MKISIGTKKHSSNLNSSSVGRDGSAALGMDHVTPSPTRKLFNGALGALINIGSLFGEIVLIVSFQACKPFHLNFSLYLNSDSSVQKTQGFAGA